MNAWSGIGILQLDACSLVCYIGCDLQQEDADRERLKSPPVPAIKAKVDLMCCHGYLSYSLGMLLLFSF